MIIKRFANRIGVENIEVEPDSFRTVTNQLLRHGESRKVCNC